MKVVQKMWKNDKKRLVALVTAVTMAGALMTGCGAGKTSDKNADGKTVFSIGNWPADKGELLDRMEAKKARFEEANPDFKVETTNWVYDLKSFYAKAAGGQLPTVYNTAFTEASAIKSAGYAADITDELKKQGIYDKMNKQILELVSENGKVYAYPYEAYVLGLNCNVKYFEQAGLMNADGTPQQPKTWDELVQFAVKVKEATGKPGFVFPTSGNNGGWHFTQLAWSYGVNFMEKGNDGKWKATFDTPEAVAALQWLKDLKWKYDVLPANTIIDFAELQKTFATGGAAMMVGGGTEYFANYGMEPDSIGAMPIPAGPKKHVALMGGKLYEVTAGSSEKQIEGAIKWIQTSATPNITEEYKRNKEDSFKTKVNNGTLITVKVMSPWNNDSETVKFDDEMIEKYANGNPAHVKPYNDFLNDVGDCEIHPEEPVCAQELYGILDGCIQAVLSDKNADCAELIKKANSDFQVNYLNNIDY